MNVRLGHVRDAQSLLLGRLDILRRVTVRVDDDGLVRRQAADKVAGLGDRRLVELRQEHVQVF